MVRQPNSSIARSLPRIALYGMAIASWVIPTGVAIALLGYLYLENAQVVALRSGSLTTLLWLSLAILGMSGAIALWTTRRIVQPLLRLRAATAEIARGNWQQRLEFDRDEELGDFAATFNAIAEQLQTSVAQLEGLNQAILESESRLLQFLEVLPVGVSIHETSGKPIYLNCIAQDLLGENALSVATGEDWIEAGQIYVAQTQQLYPFEQFPVARSLRGEKVHTRDLELHSGDRVIPLEMRSTPIIAETGEVAYAIAAFLDISERKEAEQILCDYNRLLERQVAERTAALARAEAELEGLFAAMSELVFVLDRQGRYLKVVSNRSDLLARPAENLLNRTFHDIFDSEQAETFLTCVRRVLETQHTAYLDYSLDIEQRTIWFEASISPISEETVIWVAREISDRKTLEAKLRTSEEKLRAVFEALPDPILIIDKDNNIEAPPTSPDSNWLNLTVEQFWSEENGWSWFSLIEQVRERQKIQTLDYCLLLKAEDAQQKPSPVWFSAQIAPLSDRAVIWVARNISDRKAAEIALQEAKEAAETANRAKSTFLANMSHELRSPLNAILGFAQLLTRSPTLTPDDRENANTIVRSGEHLLALINQVLDLSKIEAGRATLNETNFDLYQLFEDLEDLYALKAEEKGLQLTFNYTRDVPRYIQGDRVKLRQILINLLSNAIKFTNEGRVTLCVSAISNQQSAIGSQPSGKMESRGAEVQGSRGDEGERQQQRTNDQGRRTKDQGQMTKDEGQKIIEIAIADTGPGIAPEELEQIFEAFRQTQTGQQVQEGTGLGLSIVQKFVELMQGTLTVTSNGYTYTPSRATPSSIDNSISYPTPTPSANLPPLTTPAVPPPPSTIFSILLPVKPIEATALKENLPTQRRAIALAPNQPRYRILVVDDKDYNRQLLIKLLTPVGFEVKQASNGREAIALWETWAPHLIWMDMRMPVLDGYQATQFIKTHLKGQATAIVALTASILEEERAITLSAGCDDYVRKPFQEQVIFDKMARYLGVSYIYENPISTPPRTNSNDSSLFASLETMPSQWVQQLYQAANLIDNEQIFQLIEAIPTQHALLLESLRNWVNSFRCDEIIDLIDNYRSTRNNG